MGGWRIEIEDLSGRWMVRFGGSDVFLSGVTVALLWEWGSVCLDARSTVYGGRSWTPRVPRLEGCAFIYPKPTTLGAIVPYRVPKILGLWQAKALLPLSRTFGADLRIWWILHRL